MDTAYINNQFKQFISHITKSLIKNWKLLLVNVTGVFGLYISSRLFVISYEMAGGNIPTMYYHYIFVGSVLFGMLFLYKLVHINGRAMLEEIKERDGE